MKAEDYYVYQSTARGLHTETDVERLVSTYAPIYDRVFPRFLPADKGALIYEAACGNGIFLRWARSRGWKNLQGSDISTRELERASSAGFDVENTDSVKALKARPENSIDAIVAIDFIEHVPRDVLLEFLFAACHALKPGGCLIMRGPNGGSPFCGNNLFNDITHVWAYTPTALRSICSMAGFGQVDYLDDTRVSIQQRRWLKVPLMIVAQGILKSLFRAASHDDFRLIGASYYACARK
jgi:2-polyprenyl-3-methyl-5-hydroxy-6-metoxy-1,4-benzoquinol methylase